MSEYEAVPWSRLVTRVLAPNPGPMTLDGTNSLVARDPGSPRTIVVDPGPADAAHLGRIRELGDPELILLTHHHLDHTEAAAEFAAATGAPVRAFDEGLCIGAPPLRDGELIEAAGVSLRVLATPGHTADSVSFHLPDDAALDGADAGHGSVLTGDTILGRGTTVILPPEGSLADYFSTLDALEAIGPALVLPAHGPRLPDLTAIVAEYRGHRRTRLGEVAAAIERMRATGQEVTVAAVTDAVYADVPANVRFAAEATVRAQLDYLGGSADIV